METNMQVAILGSPGSGKTVLTAVLSKYLSGHHDRVFMTPTAGTQEEGGEVSSISTHSYLVKLLAELHKGEWPPPTPPGHNYELGFELSIENEDGSERRSYDMKLLDCPGESLQKIFLNYDSNKLSEFQQRLCNYIFSSNVVVLIVNLEHFTDADFTAREENEAVLTRLVKDLSSKKACHYILVCFTAYDKYRAIIHQKYGGANVNDDTAFMAYLKNELPMFYHSCLQAGETVVTDYEEEGYGKKMISVNAIAVAPVVAPRTGRIGKPPVGFNVKNPRHHWGLDRMANWLCDCEESIREWEIKHGGVIKAWQLQEILSYTVSPIAIFAFCGLLVWVLFSCTLINSIIFGMPIGAVIGFFVGDKLKFSIAKKDGVFFKRDRSVENEEQEEEEEEESATSRPTGRGGTSSASSRGSGASGGATGSSRTSGTGGAGATAGEEKMD